MEETSKKANLKKNFIYNLLSQVLTLIVPLVTSPYLARILLEEGNGRYSYTFSIITYFILFSNLGFTVYGQREISRERDNIAKQKQVFIEIALLRGIFTIISLFALLSILFFVGFGEKYNNLILVETTNLFAVFIDFNYFYQGREDFKSLAIKNIIIRIIGITTVFLFVKTSNDVWIYALCIGLNALFCNALLIPKIIKVYKNVKIEKISIWKHLKPSFLIFLPTLAVTIYSVFDKSMIGFLAKNSDYENGCYEQAYKINSIALSFVTAISPIFVPRNAIDYKNGDYDEVRNHMYSASNYIWLIGTPLLVGMITLSSNLSSWFLGDGYVEVPLLLSIMACRFIFSGFGTLFGDTYFIPIGKEKYPTYATFISAAVNIVLNLILIPHLGAIGAAISTAVCEFLVTFILAILIVKDKTISLKKILLSSIKYIFSALLMGIVVYFVNTKFQYSIMSFALCTLIGAIVYFVFLFLLKSSFVIDNFNKVITKINNKINIIFDKMDNER